MALRLKFNPTEPGFWVSGVTHVVLIGAAMVGLSTVASFPPAEEGMPVEVISESQFSQITNGEKTAKEVLPTQKPRVDRVSEKIEQRDPGEDKRDAPSPAKRPDDMKVAEKEEPVAAAPPPPPPPKPAETKPDAQAELEKTLIEKAEAEAVAQKVAEAKAKAEADAKAKAEADAKSKAKAEAEAKAKAEAEAKKVAEAKAKTEAEAKARKEAELAKKFDPEGIKQLLQNKEKNQSTGATGSEVQKTASLGTQTGTAAKLSPSMEDALRGLLQKQIENCYNGPPGGMEASGAYPVLDVKLNLDGSLAADPRVVRAGSSNYDRAVADAALRAVRRCAPFDIPPRFAPFYSSWKHWNFEFPPPSA